MRDEVLEELVKLRKFKPFDFMKSRTLTPELMDIITTLCKEYVAGSDEDRAKMRSLVIFEISFLFFMFSGQLAEMAVQYNSEEYLKQSLIALLIENCKFDARDTMVSMSEVFHSAQKIGMRGNEFFFKHDEHIWHRDVRTASVVCLERSSESEHSFIWVEGGQESGW